MYSLFNVNVHVTYFPAKRNYPWKRELFGRVLANDESLSDEWVVGT